MHKNTSLDGTKKRQRTGALQHAIAPFGVDLGFRPPGEWPVRRAACYRVLSRIVGFYHIGAKNAAAKRDWPGNIFTTLQRFWGAGWKVKASSPRLLQRFYGEETFRWRTIHGSLGASISAFDLWI